MLKSLSGLSEAELKYYVACIRDIAALDDDAALIETDKLLWEMFDSLSDSQEDNDEEDLNGSQAVYDYRSDWGRRIERARDAYHRLKEKVDSGTVMHYDIGSLRNYAETLKSVAPSDTPTQNNDFDAIKADINALLSSAEPALFNRVLEDGLHGTLKNINSVFAKDDRIKYALDRFSKHHEVTPEIITKVRQAKERGARFRSQRKLASAKVAEDAGFSVRAAGLRREASAILSQDWEIIFPGEVAPTE